MATPAIRSYDFLAWFTFGFTLGGRKLFYAMLLAHLSSLTPYYASDNKLIY